jgi:hypothetical protein
MSGAISSPEQQAVDAGQLGAFASIFEQCIKSIDTSMIQVKATMAQATATIQTLEQTVQRQADAISIIESENQQLKLRINGVIDNNSLLEKDMKQQIVDSTASIHKELLVHRTGTKMDLNNMKNALNKSFLEKITQFEEQMTEQNSSKPTGVVVAGGSKGGGGVDAETLNSIVQRIFTLENTSLTSSNLQEMIDMNIRSDIGSLAKFNANIVALQQQVAWLLEENNLLREFINSQIKSTKVPVTIPGDSASFDFDQVLKTHIKFIGQRAKRFSKFYYEKYRPEQNYKDMDNDSIIFDNREDKDSARSGQNSSRPDASPRVESKTDVSGALQMHDTNLEIIEK